MGDLSDHQNSQIRLWVTAITTDGSRFKLRRHERHESRHWRSFCYLQYPPAWLLLGGLSSSSPPWLLLVTGIRLIVRPHSSCLYWCLASCGWRVFVDPGWQRPWCYYLVSPFSRPESIQTPLGSIHYIASQTVQKMTQYSQSVFWNRMWNLCDSSLALIYCSLTWILSLLRLCRLTSSLVWTSVRIRTSAQLHLESSKKPDTFWCCLSQLIISDVLL